MTNEKIPSPKKTTLEMLSGNMEELPPNVVATRKKRAGAALRKIRPQFGTTPEHRLCFAILEQAVNDLPTMHGSAYLSARRYLADKIYHAEICGVNSEWLRNVLIKTGVDEFKPIHMRV